MRQALKQATHQLPPLALEASVIFEDGTPVPPDTYGYPHLIARPQPYGERIEVSSELALPLNGEPSTLSFQFGKRTLYHYGQGAGYRRLFCLQIAPSDPQLRRRFPHLSVLSEPVKVLTKLRRSRVT